MEICSYFLGYGSMKLHGFPHFYYTFPGAYWLGTVMAPTDALRVSSRCRVLESTFPSYVQVLERTRLERKRRQQQKLEQKSALQIQVPSLHTDKQWRFVRARHHFML